MQDRVVLDIRILADANEINVATHDGVVPDAGMVSQRDVAYHDGAAGNVDPLAEGGALFQMAIQL